MARSWYVSVGDKTTGPFSTEQLIEDVKQNRIPADATVCAAGLTRFHKITDEPELAAAVAAATQPAVPTVLPMAAGSACGTGKCCPMPRIIAATSLLATGAFWVTAAVAATGFGNQVATPSLSHPVGYGLAALAAIFTLALTSGIVRRKGCATCGAAKAHIMGLAGSIVLAKLYAPIILVVTGVHVLGLLASRASKKQICATKSAPTC